MDYLNADLLGHRCPDVAQKMLKTLELLIESEANYAVITTIEPSAHRDLKMAIAMKFEGELTLAEVQNSAITDERRQQILSSHEGFDEDDLAGVDSQLTMLVAKQAPTST
ncbi:hypothetical protein AAFX24_27665 [Vibrio mediterranei]|uniref:hypothetical protein n=1 Tax=Vibrio mediterranei TaxID=689 RepID=UPI0038CF17E2